LSYLPEEESISLVLQPVETEYQELPKNIELPEYYIENSEIILEEYIINEENKENTTRNYRMKLLRFKYQTIRLKRNIILDLNLTL